MKAFPRADGKFDSAKPDENGMDLRDYFAAKALNFTLKNCFTTEGAVERAYEIADAMMEARK